MDDHYEIAIPLSELGTTADHIEKYGLGVELAATFGLSAMDSLPYDMAMNDNADLPDTSSQSTTPTRSPTKTRSPLPWPTSVAMKIRLR